MAKCRCRRTNSRIVCATEVSNGGGGKRKAYLHRWVHSWSKTMGLSCTKGIFEVHYACNMARSLPTYSADAHVMLLSLWGMHSAAPWEVIPHWGITRSETSQPPSWPKCATMSAFNLSFRTCQVNYCTMLLPWSRSWHNKHIIAPVTNTISHALTVSHGHVYPALKLGWRTSFCYWSISLPNPGSSSLEVQHHSPACGA